MSDTSNDRIRELQVSLNEHYRQYLRVSKCLAKLHEVLHSRYTQLELGYVWTDPETAIDIMFAEIMALRYERDHPSGSVKASQHG